MSFENIYFFPKLRKYNIKEQIYSFKKDN